MEFDDDDIHFSVFGFFVNWLYTQKIQGKHGEPLKLINLAKLYMLFERFQVPNMGSKLLKEIEDAGYDAKGTEILDGSAGNTLGDFQAFAYNEGDDELKDIAVNKTIEALKEEDMEYDYDEMVDEMPGAMLKDFTKAVMLRCMFLEKKSRKAKLAKKVTKMNKKERYDMLSDKKSLSTPVVRVYDDSSDEEDILVPDGTLCD